MSNLFCSSIGKKVVMSLSGLFLIIFLLVHLTANLFVFGGAEAYNAACHVMGYMAVIVPVLAAGFIIHIIYAFILTIKNREARPVRYKVHNIKESSTWQSRNMLVLGIIIFGFLVLHLVDFWSKMQLLEFQGITPPNEPYDLVVAKFSNPCFTGIYIIWIIALWFHLRHGFWSAFQSVGLNNQTWIKRWKCVANIYAYVVAIGFISIPVYIYISSLIG